MNRKIISFLMALAVCLTLLPPQTALAFGDSAEGTVYVTISDGGIIPTGKDGTVMARVPMTISSGETVNDVLIALHEAYYSTGGAGYETAEQYEGVLSMTKLWGETEGVGGFYLNGVMPWTAVDQTTLSDGEELDAVIYHPDWSDQYAAFDRRTVTVGTDESVSLTLSRQYYGGAPDYALQTATAQGVTLTANGEPLNAVTDADGEASFSFSEAGTYVISAESPEQCTLTAPVCVVQVVAPVQVTCFAQQGGQFLFTNKTLTVPYGTAEKYGFSNDAAIPTGTITALDVLVAANAVQYGDAFAGGNAADYLIASKNGMPQKMFANTSTAAIGFAINSGCPLDENGHMAAADAAPVVSGDKVSFFYCEDSDGNDLLTWFTDASGARVDTACVEAGETFTLYLKGFPYADGAKNPDSSAVFGTNGQMQICTVNQDGSTTILQTAESADGAVRLNFVEAGSYCLTAIGVSNGCHVVQPLCWLTVTESGTIAGSTVTGLTAAGMTPDFSEDIHSYILPNQAYNKSAVSVKLTADGAKSITAVNNGGLETSMISGTTKSISLTAGTNTIVFTVRPDAADALPRVYTLTVKRKVTLESLSLTDDEGTAVPLNENVKVGTVAYTASVLTGTQIHLTPGAGGDAGNTMFTVNGTAEQEFYSIAAGKNNFLIQSVSADGTTVSDTTLTITGTDAADCHFTLAPTDASLTLYDAHGIQVSTGANTDFTKLLEGNSYTYTASKYGYIAAHGTICAGTDTEIPVTLTAASTDQPENLIAQWSSFRGSEDNMAIASAQTPRTAAETAEAWVSAQSFNGGYNYPSSLLIVRDRLYVAGGNQTLYELDRTTGQVLASGEMAGVDGASGSAPILYAEGMIFVPLKDGTVQAFNATTLRPVWRSENLGNQCTTALTYADGFLYGSTGNSALSKAFCLSVTDENPKSETETKYASWMAYDSAYPKGSYWSTPLAAGSAIVYGMDAVDGTSLLCSRDKATGALLSKLTLTGLGNVRSSIVCTGSTLYFTTQGGYLCSASLDLQTGVLSGLKSVQHMGITSSDSSPVVYNGVVYYGANGCVVAADADTLAEVRRTSVGNGKSKVQASPLLINAYAASDGAVYLYVTQNAKPGALYTVRDDGNSLTCAAIYTPAEAQQNYGNFSPICAEDGTLYYHNDSGYLFALKKETTVGCTVTFAVTPSNAAVQIDGRTQTAANTYLLPVGTYSYTVSASGYTSKSGTLEITQQDAAQTSKNVTIALSAQQTVPKTTVTASVKVLIHDGTKCGNAYTYKNNASAFYSIVNQKVTLESGSSVLDALKAAADAAGVSFTEGTPGYISEIGGLTEMDHGDKSGWLYTIDGEETPSSCREYTLTKDVSIDWFFTDDYTAESGAEKWNGKTTVATETGFTLEQEATVSDGCAAVSFGDAQVESAVQSIKKSNAENLCLIPQSIGGAVEVSVSLSKTSAESLSTNTSAGLEIETTRGIVAVSSAALKKITATASGSTLLFTVRETSADSTKNAAAIVVTILSGGTKITDFSDAPITVCVPVNGTYAVGRQYQAIIRSEDGTEERTTGKCVSWDGGLWVELTSRHLSTFVVTGETAAYFTDVSEENWGYEAVQYVTSRGLLTGTGGTSFSPNLPITRGQFITVLYRLAGFPPVNGTETFADVPAEMYYAAAVTWGSENGIVTGVTATAFLPNDPVSRGEIAAFLYRYAAYQDLNVSASGTLENFTDASTAPIDEKDALKWAVGAGLLTGTKQLTLCPAESANRSQTAMILMRFCQNLKQ